VTAVETPLTLLANAPALVYAAVDHDHVGYDHLSVIASRRNSMTDPWMAPVRAALAASCHAWVSSVVRVDPEMMGGEAIETEYHLYDECPRYDRYHTCRQEPDGVHE
jgi:hypothetical protein